MPLVALHSVHLDLILQEAVIRVQPALDWLIPTPSNVVPLNTAQEPTPPLRRNIVKRLVVSKRVANHPPILIHVLIFPTILVKTFTQTVPHGPMLGSAPRTQSTCNATAARLVALPNVVPNSEMPTNGKIQNEG